MECHKGLEHCSNGKLPETDSEFTPENGCLGDDPFILGRLPNIRGELLVSETYFMGI